MGLVIIHKTCLKRLSLPLLGVKTMKLPPPPYINFCNSNFFSSIDVIFTEEFSHGAALLCDFANEILMVYKTR